MKSYNSIALRGVDYDDMEFQNDMAEIGVYIPDELLYKPEMNDYVLKEMNKRTVEEMVDSKNPLTQEFYTLEEAQQEADKSTAQARSQINMLMKL